MRRARPPTSMRRCASAAGRSRSWWRTWVLHPTTSSSTPTSSPSAPAWPSTTTTPSTSSGPLGRSSAYARVAKSLAVCPTSHSASVAMTPCDAASTPPSCTTPARRAWTWASSTPSTARVTCTRSWTRSSWASLRTSSSTGARTRRSACWSTLPPSSPSPSPLPSRSWVRRRTRVAAAPRRHLGATCLWRSGWPMPWSRALTSSLSGIRRRHAHVGCTQSRCRSSRGPSWTA
mmetsp:Transcript_12096/g.36273  ORF Transcript_12096/g.36273 Transcript_12096/m.36273 type:complete len:232 (-) Transcript_12096:1936-2631(-)